MNKPVKIIALAATLILSAALSGCSAYETEIVNAIATEATTETSVEITETTEVTTETSAEITETTEATTETSAEITETTEATTITTTETTEYVYEPTEIHIGETMTMAGGGCKAEMFGAYDYGTKITFVFNFTEAPSDIEKAWEYAKNASEKMLGIDDYESITADECAVKLIVDGEQVPFVRGENAKPMEVNVYIYEVNVATKKAGFDLTFKPIEYENAESVVLQIDTDDGVKKINIK